MVDVKKHAHDHYHDHDDTILGELVHHLPYSIFSAAFSLIIVGFVSFFAQGLLTPRAALSGYSMLFHSFHFMHIVFAATGTIIMYRRYSTSVVGAFLIGIISPTIFCTLSDSIMPYLGGRALGVPMHFHLCFLTELANVLPFLIVGIANGFVMSGHQASRQGIYSVFSHFIHIFVSALASTFYLVANGFLDWYTKIGFVFIFIIIAVVIPCTFSDVVVPMACAKRKKNHEKH